MGKNKKVPAGNRGQTSYRNMGILSGDTIEEALKDLLAYKETGKALYGTYKGVTFYSDTVTLDSAYKTLTGFTKEEYDRKQNMQMKMREEFELLKQHAEMEKNKEGKHNGKEYEKVGFLGSTIVETVEKLLEYKEQGRLVYRDFNGVFLYSDTVTIDSAYKEITGYTQEEYENIKKKRMEAFEEHTKRIPELTKEWAEKGREILAEDKWKRWDEIVSIRLPKFTHGVELGECLDIIRILNTGGTLEEAKEKMDVQDHSDEFLVLIREMVKQLCERGNEFVSYSYRKPCTRHLNVKELLQNKNS